jgi:hypothetical protein
MLLDVPVFFCFLGIGSSPLAVMLFFDLCLFLLLFLNIETYCLGSVGTRADKVRSKNTVGIENKSKGKNPSKSINTLNNGSNVRFTWKGNLRKYFSKKLGDDNNSLSTCFQFQLCSLIYILYFQCHF